jgi:hypothetical protein
MLLIERNPNIKKCLLNIETIIVETNNYEEVFSC